MTGGRWQFSHRFSVPSCQVWIEQCAIALAASSSVEKQDLATPEQGCPAVLAAPMEAASVMLLFCDACHASTR